METNLYPVSVPVFERMLRNLITCLDKAQAHAQARGFSPDAYLALRLAPDMLPFTKQIHIAGDSAKAALSRLAGREVPKWDDDETTLAQLRARIQRTIDHVVSFGPEDLAGAATREVSVPMRNRDPLVFRGDAYLCHYALPNFYFHLTTAYALLRQAGVPLGKSDYLGG
ncbi:MAG: DUF1993 domain-containing protein [Rubrivivax sp.]|nr:DUF1993 domain-containing protein [Rubrivivax sp.]